MISPSSDSASREPSYAMIIGAMKCGTTSLYEMLAQHPNVAPCRTKEPHYFCHDRTRAYEDLWEADDPERFLRIEASTSYTKYPYAEGVPERIKRYGLSPRFIYLVRDPIDRIESQYNFMLHHLGKRPSGFEDPQVTSVSMYYMQLERFLGVFPDRNRFLVLDFDEFVTDPYRVLQVCTDFLGLSPTPTLKMRSSNSTASSASDVWIQRLGPLKNRIGHVLPAGFRSALKSALRRATPSVKRELNAVDQERLRVLLRDDLERFGKAFSFDVTRWGF